LLREGLIIIIIIIIIVVLHVIGCCILRIAGVIMKIISVM